jgi:hypothetical protein
MSSFTRRRLEADLLLRELLPLAAAPSPCHETSSPVTRARLVGRDRYRTATRRLGLGVEWLQASA